MPLLQKNGELSPLCELTVKDLFKRLDKISINCALSYEELNEFMEQGFNEKLDKRDYKRMIQMKYCHDSED